MSSRSRARSGIQAFTQATTGAAEQGELMHQSGTGSQPQGVKGWRRRNRFTRDSPFRGLFLNGLQAIGAAGGRESAAGADHRGDETPVKADAGQGAAARTWLIAWRSWGIRPPDEWLIRASREMPGTVSVPACPTNARLSKHLPTYVSLPRPSSEDHAARVPVCGKAPNGPIFELAAKPVASALNTRSASKRSRSFASTTESPSVSSCAEERAPRRFHRNQPAQAAREPSRVFVSASVSVPRAGRQSAGEPRSRHRERSCDRHRQYQCKPGDVIIRERKCSRSWRSRPGTRSGPCRATSSWTSPAERQGHRPLRTRVGCPGNQRTAGGGVLLQKV